MGKRMKFSNYGLALLAGASCVAGFAPIGYYPVPVLALSVLFVLWSLAKTPREAAGLGFFFGLGLFSTGVSWIYVALHDYGDMNFWLAGPATLLFASFLSLFTALAGYLQARISSNTLRIALAMPAAWVLFEWVRGTIFTGFPWLTLGYAESNSVLAGYAPILGAYGVSLVAALCSGLLALALREKRSRLFSIALLAVILIAGASLRSVSWTHPVGQPFSVALVQGNIPQDIKFNPDSLNETLNIYKDLVIRHPAKLTVLPETAFPMMEDEVPEPLMKELSQHARRNGGDILIGAFEREDGSYFNSVFSTGSSESQHYRKHHLVIFGEFIPLRPVLGWLINDVLNIPMGDLARGSSTQPPLSVAGQRVSVDICYEDVFGEEIIGSLPDATLLVNATNDAWYGDSFAAAQHRQMSQMRALETGRMMLRATNTGETVIIGTDGRVLERLPQHERAVLQGIVQGYGGETPYVRFGNTSTMIMIALLLAISRWPAGFRIS